MRHLANLYKISLRSLPQHQLEALVRHEEHGAPDELAHQNGREALVQRRHALVGQDFVKRMWHVAVLMTARQKDQRKKEERKQERKQARKKKSKKESKKDQKMRSK